MLSTRTFRSGHRLLRLRPFLTGFVSTAMSKPLPAPPERFDLVQCFDALALAGKKPNTEKSLPDPPKPISPPRRTFVGGFIPKLWNSGQRRPPPPPAVNGNATGTALLPEAKAPSRQMAMPTPTPAPQTGKQSLTMQYAIKSMRPNTPTLAPPFITVPPRPRSDSIVSPRVVSNPPLSAMTNSAQPAVVVTSNRPRAVSAPLSPATSSGKNTTQCSGMTKAGKQCSRQVKLPATHSHLDPTPVLYCHQHKETMLSAQTGFYVRKAGNADRFVEFSCMRTLEVKQSTGRLISFRRLYTHIPADGYPTGFESRNGESNISCRCPWIYLHL